MRAHLTVLWPYVVLALAAGLMGLIGTPLLLTETTLSMRLAVASFLIAISLIGSVPLSISFNPFFRNIPESQKIMFNQSAYGLLGGCILAVLMAYAYYQASQTPIGRGTVALTMILVGLFGLIGALLGAVFNQLSRASRVATLMLPLVLIALVLLIGLSQPR